MDGLAGAAAAAVGERVAGGAAAEVAGAAGAGMGAAGAAASEGLKGFADSFGGTDTGVNFAGGGGGGGGIFGFSVGWIFASLVVSAIGFVLLNYGRKMGRIPQVVVGVLLMVYPYFVPSLVPMVIVGAGLCVALWVVVRMGW